MTMRADVSTIRRARVLAARPPKQPQLPTPPRLVLRGGGVIDRGRRSAPPLAIFDGVIVWINGAFGVGKTSVAKSLVGLWGGATLFDPEGLGFVLSRFPSRYEGDFQDLRSWRRWTFRSLMVMSRVRSRIVVPMTLVNPDYFREIVGALRLERDVRHFTLQADADTIRERLQPRGEGGAWAEQQVDRCLAGLADPLFATHVRTADRTIEEITEEILGELALSQDAFRQRSREGQSRWVQT